MANREWNPKSFFRHLGPRRPRASFNRVGRRSFALDGEGPAGEQVYRGWKALPRQRARRHRNEVPAGERPVGRARARTSSGYAQQVWTNGHAARRGQPRLVGSDLAVRLFVADEVRCGSRPIRPTPST